MLERILRFSIERRWTVVVLAIIVAGAGVLSLRRLPIDAVPDITNNQVQINTLFPALSPLEIEKQVTFPIETALSGIPGLAFTRSLSRNGFSQVTAVFGDDVDVYFARQQVGERLIEARESMPVGAEPVMGPISTGLGEIYMYTVEFEHPDGKGSEIQEGRPGWQKDGSYLTAEGRRLTLDFERAAYLREVQDWIIRPQLKNVKDVAGVDSIGGYEKQFHVQPDPMKLVSRGLTFHDVIEALERNNVSAGAGYIEHRGESYTVRATGRIATEKEIGEVAIATREGRPIFIRDVADVGIGKELRTGSATENGNEVVVGTALMLIGANSRTAAQAVDAKMTEIRRSLPPDVRAKTVLDRTVLVDATIGTVAKNLTEGALLVIVILFLMLGNFRAAIITALAIPLSMLITATAMVQSRVSGNLMSLGAIDFGLVVDGAVIIVENSLRRLAERQHALGRILSLDERLTEVREASKEMIRPSVFGQAIIVTVYVPILALTGIEGKMFQPMALTVIFALAAAFVLSLTLVPALVAICITGRVKEAENVLVRAAKRVYEPTVRFAVRARLLVVSAAVIIFVASCLLFLRLGQEFVPTLDEKNIAMHAMRVPSTGIAQSTEMQKEVERVIAQFPEVAYVFSKTGTAELASDPMPPNVSDTFIMLHPHDKWPDKSLSKSTLIERIENAVSAVPGHAYEFTQPIQMRFNELISGVRSDVAVKVYGDDFETMMPTAQAIAEVLGSTRGGVDAKVEQTEGLPMMTVDVDRGAAARYGLSVADVQDVVVAAIGGRESGQVFEGDRRFSLVVRLSDAVRVDIKNVGNLPIPLPAHDEADGAALASSERTPKIGTAPRYVPLSSVATIDISTGLNQVSRENGRRRVVVQCNVRGRDLGSFVGEAQARIAAEVKVRPGQWLEWGGEFENLVAAKKRLLLVVPLCFLFIMLLLYMTFRSLKYALIVFSGVPLALSGGILALWLRGISFSISAAVGFIALSGVAVLNGLVMLTFINQLRAAGEPLDTSIVRGSMTRLRPVLMTALVASLGFVPMALASGTGAEVQRPLATVVIGGILSSTLLTLVVLPALYRLWHRDAAVRSDPEAGVSTDA